MLFRSAVGADLNELCLVLADAAAGAAHGKGRAHDDRAPADDPEIAIAVYVEKGAQGGTLGTIARDILTAYFSEAGSTDTVPAENTLN